jgi:hypothetical protein
MTDRLSDAPPVVELKANHLDGWANVAADSAAEMERLQAELRGKQM